MMTFTTHIVHCAGKIAFYRDICLIILLNGNTRFLKSEWTFLKPLCWEMHQPLAVRTKSANPWRLTTTTRTWRWSMTSSMTSRGWRAGSGSPLVTWWPGSTTTTTGPTSSASRAPSSAAAHAAPATSLSSSTPTQTAGWDLFFVFFLLIFFGIRPSVQVQWYRYRYFRVKYFSLC